MTKALAQSTKPHADAACRESALRRRRKVSTPPCLPKQPDSPRHQVLFCCPSLSCPASLTLAGACYISCALSMLPCHGWGSVPCWLAGGRSNISSSFTTLTASLLNDECPCSASNGCRARSLQIACAHACVCKQIFGSDSDTSANHARACRLRLQSQAIGTIVYVKHGEHVVLDIRDCCAELARACLAIAPWRAVLSMHHANSRLDRAAKKHAQINASTGVLLFKARNTGR